jgi:uridine phosphorylase
MEIPGSISGSRDDTSETAHSPKSRIRAASVQMVYAQRDSQEVITPEEVDDLEAWVGRAVLECLSKVDIEKDVR